MEIQVFETHEQLSQRTADLIEEAVMACPSGLFCLPAGDTPGRAFEILAEHHDSGKVSFARSRFIGLDEWLGVTPQDSGSCRNFLFSKLFTPLNIRPDQIVFFDSLAQDPESECRRVDTWLTQNGPITLMVLGIGMNGHVGLNEPGCPPNAGCQVVKLDGVTRQVMKKYFTREIKVDRGITLGMRHIMRSGSILLLASGPRKAHVVEKVIYGDASNEVPASLLRLHNNCTLFVDRTAASLPGEDRP